jgi:hypothetical protein
LPASVPEFETVALRLASATAEDYCRGILSVPHAETWWWQTGLAPYRGYSRPFKDRDGRWWWRIKPQFSWLIDFFTPLERPPRMPLGKSMFGWQYPVAPAEANSLTHFNVIEDINGFDLSRVADQKRRAIRKGLRGLIVAPLDPRDPAATEDARVVWNSHVERTGWNQVFDAKTYAEHWRPLADEPGTNVLGARDRATGGLAAWLVARIVEGTLYVDTIASHTDRTQHRPNDTLIFAALFNAARLEPAGRVRHANYFLRSSLETLEKFKQSMGFDSSGIPSKLHVNPLAATALKAIKPAMWKRLQGDWMSAAVGAVSDRDTVARGSEERD